MHPSALKYGQIFFEKYLQNRTSEQLIIVDVGSQDVNGSLRQFSPTNANYIGVDFAEGNGVDIVITDPYNLPFETGTIDAIVCSSVFEHSEFFWLLFQECLRIVKPSGLIYINAPSNGMIHRYPIDGWRFYPDAAHSLVNWARRFDQKPLLLESFIGPKLGPLNGEGMWNDFVAVFVKDESHKDKYTKRILDNEGEAIAAYSQGQFISKSSNDLSPDTKLHVAHLKTISEERAAAELLRTSLKEEQSVTELLRASLREEQSAVQQLRGENIAIRQSNSWRITKPLRFIAHYLK